MLLIIVVSAFFTAFELLSVLGKFSPKWLRRTLGYEWAIDLLMSFGLMFWFATTGSITGIIISAISGFIFSVILYAAKHMIGYAKLERVPGEGFKWVEYPASWSWNGAGSLIGRVIRGIGKAFKGLAAGFVEAKNAPQAA